MSGYMTMRIALPAILAATLCSNAALAQRQDEKSVAEAARRAREQKKPAAKSAKVITNDDVKPAVPETPATPASSPVAAPASPTPAPAGDTANAPAAPAPPAAPAAPASNGAAPPPAPAGDTANAPAAPAPPAASAAASSGATQASKDEGASKEITALKEKIKQAQGDLNLLQRELSLEQDNYYSNSDYVHDTAGKAKLDGLKQQISDKQQELDGLKARLARLQQAQSGSAPPPKP